jgi:hypothetical protein
MLEFLSFTTSMNAKNSPVYARRLRLSKGAIGAALVLTGAAVLTVFEFVRPASVALDPPSAVPVEAPVIPAAASQMITRNKHASTENAALQPVRQ